MLEDPTQLPDAVSLLDEFQRCRTPQEVGAALVARTARLGLVTYAIGGMPTPSDPNPTPFTIHNWPEHWHHTYMSRGFGAIDPVPRAVMVCAMPLTIAELRAGKAGFVPGPETDDYFAAAEAMGRGAGLIVPIAGPHGYHGIVVMVGATADLTPHQRAVLHLWAIYAHDRMLTLFGRAQSQGPQLTEREVEVLRLARNGEVDEAVAQAMGISVRTVRFHFENARKKLGAKTRAEALVTAVGMHLLGQ